MDHIIYVRGDWHNDDTAGVYVWCETCDVLVIKGDDFDDVLTPEQISTALERHVSG